LKIICAREGKELKLSPKISLAFPSNDIDYIEKNADNFHLVANFLWLCSSDSPLPSYYLEEWLDQALNDDLSVKDFLDIFHQRLYELLYSVWEKGRLTHQLIQNKNRKLKTILYNIAGLSVTDNCEIMQQQPHLHCYLRFFLHGNKNILNLRILLQQYLKLDVDVSSFYQSSVKIHQQQLNSLALKNHSLGMNCYLGTVFPSINTNILIKLNKLTFQQFEDLMPGKKMYDDLKTLLRFYLNKPLICFLELNLAEDQIEEERIEKKAQSLLGEKSWLGEMQTKSHYKIVLQVA
jgi:type VI secretion system protein ImpH